MKANGTDKVRVFSIDISGYAEFGLNEEDAPKRQWARYIFGVCREIIKRGGVVSGFDAVFAGNDPWVPDFRRRQLSKAVCIRSQRYVQRQ